MKEIVTEKPCISCKKVKPIKEFHKDKSTTLGLRGECKKCGNKRNREWKRVHPEVASKYLKEHQVRHNEYNRNWLSAHPGKIEEYNHRRRARKTGNGGKFTAKEWRLLKEIHNSTCLRCGKKEPDVRLEPDHVIPLVLGGSNSIKNIQPLCGSCNRKKSAKHIDYRSFK